jgi:hypothetical protein
LITNAGQSYFDRWGDDDITVVAVDLSTYINSLLPEETMVEPDIFTVNT